MSALRWTAVSGTSTPRRCAAAVPSLDRRVEPAITLWQAGSDTRPSRIHHGAARGTKASSPAGTAGGRDGEGHPLGSRITRRTTWSAAQNPSMSHPSHDIVLGRVNRRVMAERFRPAVGETQTGAYTITRQDRSAITLWQRIEPSRERCARARAIVLRAAVRALRHDALRARPRPRPHVPPGSPWATPWRPCLRGR
jgi:hypothetical protein